MYTLQCIRHTVTKSESLTKKHIIMTRIDFISKETRDEHVIYNYFPITPVLRLNLLKHNVNDDIDFDVIKVPTFGFPAFKTRKILTTRKRPYRNACRQRTCRHPCDIRVFMSKTFVMFSSRTVCTARVLCHTTCYSTNFVCFYVGTYVLHKNFVACKTLNQTSVNLIIRASSPGRA